MEVAKMKLEYQAAGDRIKDSWKSFKKHDKTRKNAVYKEKYLKKLDEDWQEFVDIDEQLLNALGTTEAGLESFKTEVESTYAKYKQALMLLPNKEEEEKNEFGKGINDAALKKALNQQELRVDGLLRLINQIQTKIDDNEELSMSYCKIKSQNLTSYWERILIAHEELGSNLENLPKEYIEKIESLEIDYEENLMQLQERLEPAKTQGEGIKLPRVTIPKFEGDYFTWINFRDLFSSMVVDNKNLSDAQRMQMLKTSLATDSEAEKLIRDLTLSPQNFQTAWDRLKHRYENEKVVVNKYLKKLITLPHMKKESNDSIQIKNLYDQTDQALLALKNLGRPVESWDDWIVITISHKLNDELKREWEKQVGHETELPTWTDLKKILEEEYRISESIEARSGKRYQQQSKPPNSIRSNQVSVEKKNCPKCKLPHSIFKCEEFKKMKVDERWNLAKKSKLCFKCLGQHEDVLSCDKENPCKKCTKGHSTWLHDDKQKGKQVKVNNATTSQHPNEGQGKSIELGANMALIQHVGSNKNELLAAHSMTSKQVLLATALVATNSIYGQKVLLRTLIDFGSQGSMITDTAVALLQLKPMVSNTRITPIGGGTSIRAKSVTITVQPRFESQFKLMVECYCLKKITKPLPNENLNIENWSHIHDLVWADPRFNKVGPIDLLLGADNIGMLIKEGIRKGKLGEPIAQNTELGWIVSGQLDPSDKARKNFKALMCGTECHDNDLRKFWELEDLNPKRDLTKDELRCEELFKQGCSRNNDGHFTVKIPFKDGEFSPDKLGNSRNQAIARFGQLERRLANNPELEKEYVRVMNEYIALGHMKEVDGKKKKLYYIPHHAVFKPNSLTTKTRVVFDASAKSTTGISLNNCMYTGSRQQDDLFELLIRWRTFKVVFKADIEKMYRQIEISENDQQYHTVIWRDDVSKALKEYQLTTVTFGTAAAPYLATRVLKQIGLDGEIEYPVGAQKVMNDFYVDDLLSGAENLEQAITAKNEIVALLKNGKMNLRKWTSNNQDFLDTLPVEETEKSVQIFSEDTTSNTLGLQWNPRVDVLSFKVDWHTEDGPITKRRLLSEASKIFDPLGWLAPVVLKAKLFMQEVWISKVDWDDEVPKEIRDQWIQYRNDVVRLGEIEIPRWIEYDKKGSISLHGFCDGSEKAYTANVYTRNQLHDQVIIRLIASKTRVAPKATKTTIPKLELCGAVLVKNLMNRVKDAMKLGDIEQYAWSDSMITLGWIQADPGRWKTFVANRVAEIQNNGLSNWNYVKSEENPADCASRGIMPSELKGHKLWWTGPEWLKNDPATWETISVPKHELEQRKQITVNVAFIEDEVIERFSSWKKLVRTTAWLKRWKNKNKGPLVTKEIQDAKQCILKQCQLQSFGKEIRRLEKGKHMKKDSTIISLNPILGTDGLLRVGGRLEQSALSYESKHPIILPANHHITRLIIETTHEETAHGGPQVMITILRNTYWVIRGKRAVNNVYKSCVICKRQAGKVSDQLMGDLPVNRVTFTRAFLHTGVDYTGEIEIRSSRLRKAPTVKGYIALFVCFATKAIHLEIVSDQSSDAFLAAFQRFTARRGLCSDIYSDNGTNFVGASNKLERDLFLAQNQNLANYAANKGIEWHFIPVNSPHQGGLWERNIGCMKTHLKKVLGTTKLTFEEYGTVLCQIEATLNSRPIGPLTEDPENLNVLTPGHFLIGDALLAIPQPTVADNKQTTLNRWKHLQLLHQHFWKRWSTEYLTQLQQRNKWTTQSTNVQTGDLVLIKDDDLPPRKWKMGRIIEVHPGKDGRVRVASMKTESGIATRTIKKICPLLENENPETEEESATVNGTKEAMNTEAEPSKPTLAVKKKKAAKEDPQATYWNNRTLRPRPLKSLLWLTIISFCFLLTGAFGNTISKEAPITVTKFVDQPGIYFEKLGHAGVITSNWRILLKIEMNKFQYELKILQDSVRNLTKLCDDTSHCSEYASRLSSNIQEIKRTNELIQTNGARRMKRSAPMGIVGWMQHEIFGVMDENQAEEISQDFESVKKNENHLLELIKNQTTVADLTTDLIKTTHDEINQNYAKIAEIIEDLSNQTTKTDQWLGLAVYLSLLAQNLKDFQDNLWNMLVDMHQGHINPHLFTPDIFIEQLEKINNNLPPGSKVPKSPQDDLRSLYELLRGRTRASGDRIIFEIILPLVSTSDYEMFKVIPIPTKFGQHRVSIVPESEYLMITLEKDKFYPLSESEYKSCLSTRNGKKICSLQQQMYNAQSNHSKCERELLRRSTTLHPSCELKITKDENVWIKLQRENEWIYGLSDEVTLNVICDGESFPMVLKGTGGLKFNTRCQIIQPEMTISSAARKFSEGDFKFDHEIPNLNLSTIMTEHKKIALNFTIDHARQLQIIHEQLNQIHEQTYLERIQHYTHFSLHITIWIVAIGLALILWIKRHTLRKLVKLMSTYMMTSSGNLINVSWRNWNPLQQRVDNARSLQQMQMIDARGQDVQDGHFSTNLRTI